jgi:hypothetical protein
VLKTGEMGMHEGVEALREFSNGRMVMGRKREKKASTPFLNRLAGERCGHTWQSGAHGEGGGCRWGVTHVARGLACIAEGPGAWRGDSGPGAG